MRTFLYGHNHVRYSPPEKSGRVFYYLKFMNSKQKAQLKIVLGIILMLGGVFGVKLFSEGVKEIGTLGEMQLAHSTVLPQGFLLEAHLINRAYLEKAVEAEKLTGKPCGAYKTFVDGELYNQSDIDLSDKHIEECFKQ